MANKFKNEATFNLGEYKFTMRPTFNCLVEIEDRTGKGILEFVQSVPRGKASTRDTMIVVQEGARAAGTHLTDKEVQAIIEKNGLVRVQEALADFAAIALYGGTELDEVVSEESDTGSDKKNN